MKHQDIVLTLDDLSLLAKSAFGFCAFAMRSWDDAIHELMSVPSATQELEQRMGLARCCRFAEWMKIIGDAALVSSTAMGCLLAVDGRTRKAMRVAGPRGMRTRTRQSEFHRRNPLLSLTGKANRELTALLAETQEVVQQVESELDRVVPSGNFELNRSTRLRLTRFARILDHFEIHVTCLKQIVEEGMSRGALRRNTSRRPAT